ncbi:MAG: hypothetical protein ACW967_01795 [Candidatus Hodarchaeales archaeon]|jgi:predicted methyltransferase
MESKNVPILSYKSLIEIQNHLKLKKVSVIDISLDLNISSESIKLLPENNQFILPNGDIITFPSKFNHKDKVCYAIENFEIFPLKLFDEITNFFYKLVPTSNRPILLVSATPFHKKPFLDCISQLQLTGKILDGGTGLGYSAIIASRTAKKIETVEWDKNVLLIASYNPYSADLFNNENIDLIEDDITEYSEQQDDCTYENIIQDGGMPKSSGKFFSLDHAKQLYRILKPRGKLIIYLPKHGKSKGRDFGGEQIQRLKKAKFHLADRKIEDSYAILIK